MYARSAGEGTGQCSQATHRDWHSSPLRNYVRLCSECRGVRCRPALALASTSVALGYKSLRCRGGSPAPKSRCCSAGQQIVVRHRPFLIRISILFPLLSGKHKNVDSSLRSRTTTHQREGKQSLDRSILGPVVVPPSLVLTAGVRPFLHATRRTKPAGCTQINIFFPLSFTTSIPARGVACRSHYLHGFVPLDAGLVAYRRRYFGSLLCLGLRVPSGCHACRYTRAFYSTRLAVDSLIVVLLGHFAYFLNTFQSPCSMDQVRPPVMRRSWLSRCSSVHSAQALARISSPRLRFVWRCRGTAGCVAPCCSLAFTSHLTVKNNMSNT